MAKKKAAPKGGAATGERVDGVTGEILSPGQSSVPALSSENKSMVVGGATITLKRVINRPVLRHPQGTNVFFTITAKMRVGKEIKATAGAAAMAPATIIDVLDTHGNEMAYIVPAVLKGMFDEDYPKDSYVGKSFSVFKSPKAEGKRHCDIALAEVDIKRG